MTTRPSYARTSFLLAACGFFIAGCWPGQRPGGAQYSVDECTYESTQEFPQSVKVTDLSTNAILWQLDVPVGQQVVIRFEYNYDPDNVTRPALMRWEIKPRGDQFGELHNVMPAPDRTQRRVDVYLRKDNVAVPFPEQVNNPRKPPKMRDGDGKPMYSP